MKERSALRITSALIKVAFEALWANKLRSGLTLLGVMIGVTSVMTIISALEGMSNEIEQQFATLGPTTFQVGKMVIVLGEEDFRRKIKRRPITLDNAQAIVEGCDLCEEVSPLTTTSATVKYGNNALKQVGIMGGEANYIDIVDVEVAEGRFSSQEDDLYKRPVAFIGDKIREVFFSGVDPIGKTIKI
ncbi:MAG: hypothetical protein D6800_02125, partial [Candidatus Zixiibacteriota bacterium]